MRACLVILCCLLLDGVLRGAAHAQPQTSANDLLQIETKYVFGFTEGSGIGLEGEKEVSIDTEARLGKSGGRYWASESKLEFEFTPSQYVQFEFGPFFSAHNISNVPGLDDRKQVNLGGAFGEIRYLLLDRNPSSPLALTVSAEPEWRRTDETTGSHVNNVELELKLNADVELVKNRLYFGSNLLYESEGTRDPDGIGGGWEKESKLGVSGALSYRVTPTVLAGAELWYLRHYDGMWANSFTGDAFYVGPTLFVQITPKAFITAAWNVQVAGSDVDDPTAHLNLSEFSRHRFKIKTAFEF